MALKFKTKILFLIALLFGAWPVVFGHYAHAGVLSYVTDLITTSLEGVPADHTIRFQTTENIPASGKIIINFDSNDLSLPTDLDHNDIDFGVSLNFNGPFTERSLAALASVSDDGVSIVSGPAGTITITLNNTSGIPAGSYMRLAIGFNAQSQAPGAHQIVNPAVKGSYHIRLETRDATNSLLDFGSTLIAIMHPVEILSDTKDYDPPTRLNGLPTSSVSIPAGIRMVEISLNTDEVATCRYATSSGVGYYFMTNNFRENLSNLHTALVTGLADSTTYNFYVRCIDFVPNANPDDYIINFSVAAPLPPPVTDGSGGGSGGGYGQSFPPSTNLTEISLSGRSYPGSTVIILKNNSSYMEVPADGNGRFQAVGTGITQGTHTFSLYARDGDGRRSAAYSTTLTIISGTRNTVSGIIIAPTIALSKNTVSPGGSVTVSGKSVPGATVEVRANLQKKGSLNDKDILKFNTVASASGAWRYELSTKDFSNDTYEIRARSLLDASNSSGYSQALLLGVGRAPTEDSCGKSDINRDGKVNLVDFSIMLFNWNTSDPDSDINGDGKVNLTDFSILLFCWTG